MPISRATKKSIVESAWRVLQPYVDGAQVGGSDEHRVGSAFQAVCTLDLRRVREGIDRMLGSNSGYIVCCAVRHLPEVVGGKAALGFARTFAANPSSRSSAVLPGDVLQEIAEWDHPEAALLIAELAATKGFRLLGTSRKRMCERPFGAECSRTTVQPVRTSFTNAPERPTSWMCITKHEAPPLNRMSPSSWKACGP